MNRSCATVPAATSSNAPVMAVRPTRDIDVQARIDVAEVEHIHQIVREIAAPPADDGLHFNIATSAAHTIRDEDESTGVRVTLSAFSAEEAIDRHSRRDNRGPAGAERHSMLLDPPDNGSGGCDRRRASIH